MPKITFIRHSGERHIIEAEVGESVMQVAVNSAIPGILADCGGNCACATCHVYVGAAWTQRIEPPSRTEREMIECAMDPQSNSRLSCQILIAPDHEGLEVQLPKSQV